MCGCNVRHSGRKCLNNLALTLFSDAIFQNLPVTLTNACAGKFRGFFRVPVKTGWWQPADSQLPCLPTVSCEPCASYSFLKTNATVKRNKEATYFIYVSKVWWKEGAGHITLSASWYHSILADQFSQREGDEKGASTRRSKGGSWNGGGIDLPKKYSVVCFA